MTVLSICSPVIKFVKSKHARLGVKTKLLRIRPLSKRISLASKTVISALLLLPSTNQSALWVCAPTDPQTQKMTIVKTIPKSEKCDGVEVGMERADVLLSTIYKNARKRHCRTKDQITEIWHRVMMPGSESEEVIGGASEIQTYANKLDTLKKGLKRLNQCLGIHVLVDAFFQDKITIQKDHQRWGECAVLPVEK
jgi:hypothetical protein